MSSEDVVTRGVTPKEVLCDSVLTNLSSDLGIGEYGNITRCENSL